MSLWIISFCLTNPQSTTYLIPGTVIDVCAIFVAKTIFLIPSEEGLNINFCSEVSKVEYIGQIINPLTY
jgi:hypothetical protein